MTEVNSSCAREMLLSFKEDLTSKRPRELREPLNALIEYLGNSTDKMVINLLNNYPFEPRKRDIPEMAANTEALLKRFENDQA